MNSDDSGGGSIGRCHTNTDAASFLFCIIISPTPRTSLPTIQTSLLTIQNKYTSNLKRYNIRVQSIAIAFLFCLASCKLQETICLEIPIAIKVLSFVSECLAILSLGSCNLSRTPASAAAGPLHCSYRI